MEEQAVIEKCEFEEGDFMNNVFLREKKSKYLKERRFRVILNLKKLNDYVRYQHFKIDGLDSCVSLMEPGCYMANIDIVNAYHTVRFSSDFTRYLKFRHNTQVYKYLCLPQGFSSSPRIFTKMLRPILTHFRRKKILCSMYIDDLYLQGSSYMEVTNNISYIIQTLTSLGFEISPKSTLIPTQRLHHLGFILDSDLWLVSLSEDKRSNIIKKASKVLTSKEISVRCLARLIGTFVATFPAVEYGPLFYRELELLKIKSLRTECSFDKMVALTPESITEIEWWINEGVYIGKPISREHPQYVIRSDASKSGWAAVMGEKVTHGTWTHDEAQQHINVLEMKGAMFGIKALCNDLKACHVQVQIDNTTAVAYVNNMGGTHSQMCNTCTKDLLLWCKERSIWLTSCHIAGVDNVEADYYSRKKNDQTEWMLDKNVFQELCMVFGYPEIDLFASRTNWQLEKYMSFVPDANAFAIDSFAHKWDTYVYIFPPFNMIPRILKKIQMDETPKVLMIIPLWESQTWWPKLCQMYIQEPYKLRNQKRLLHLPLDPSAVHPLYPKLKLAACLLSGINSSLKACQKGL